MKKSLLIAWLILGTTWSFSQERTQRSWGEKPPLAKVSGMVVDEDNNPVPYASVAQFRLRDSSLAGGAASNGEGMFEFESRPGRYFFKVSFLSFDDRTIGPISIRGEDVGLGTITLQHSAQNLDEVTIEAERPQMELKLDKRVFNVDKNLANKGANAAELLDNIPSVAVDVEGNVSLRGSQNVRILIDGKPSGLIGISSTDALRQLQGDQVEKVEVITNPSARYDAEGEVGIINIVLKEEKRKGITGSVEARVGRPENYGISANFSVRKSKWNYFGSYGINWRQGPGVGFSTSEFDYPDTSFSYNQVRTHQRGGLNQTGRIGFGYSFNKFHNLNISGMYRRGDGVHNTVLDYVDFDEFGNKVQTVDRREDETDVDENYEFNLNYRKTFEKKDRLFTFDVRLTEGSEVEEAEINEESDNPLYIPFIQRSFADEKNTHYIIQTDYVYPFLKEGRFEMGAKAMLRTLDLDYQVEDQASDASWVINPIYDNHMIYHEDIYAAYVMAGNKTGRWSYQAGLRAEYSDVSTELLQTGDYNPRQYLSLFPSAHFSFEVREESYIQLSYSRRIRRPRHWYLIPFFTFADNRNFIGGNPDLNPEFTDSYETGFLRQWKKGSVLASVYYRHANGIIQRVVLSDSLGLTSKIPINLGTRDDFGVEFNTSFRPYKWWDLNFNFNYFSSVTTGSYEGQDFGAEALAWTTRVFSKWRVKRKLNVQTSFNYRSPRNNVQGRTLAIYSWDGGASVDILKGKGTLSFSARDILNSRKRRMEAYGEFFTQISTFQWRARQLMLTFNYRINQKKKREGRNGGFGGEGMDMDM